MKAGTVEKIKFLKLMRRLGESKRGVVGLLELLWHATARDAPQGDIGKHDNESIAIMCDWEGDPDELVDALVATGWLDKHPDHRLVVHDWAQHCPTYVKGGVKRMGLDLIGTTSEVQPIGTTSEVVSTNPIQSKPIQAYIDRSIERPIDVEVVRKDCQRIVDDVDPMKERRTPMKDRDRELVIRVTLAKWQIATLNPHEISERIAQKRREGAAPKRPWAYFKAAVKKRCEQLGVDFHAQLDTLEIPPELQAKE